MTTPNTNLTRDSAIAAFQTLITQPINAISGKWATGANPGGTKASSYSPAALVNIVLPGDTIYTGPVGTDITAGNAQLSNITTVLQDAAKVMSRARQVNLRKTRYPYSSYWYDVTNVTHLNSSYQMASAPAGPAAGDISATAFDIFVAALQTAVTNHRNNTLVLTEYYCHTNCHSSHSSRGRR